jgi:signal peptide peptidase SppA
VSGPAAEASSEPSISLDITTSAASSTDAQDSPAPHLPSTIAFCDTFTSQSSYLLASAFDKVYLQPSGAIPLTGISAQIPFFSRLISKLGIKVHAEARREYKSMISQFKEKDGLPPLQAQNEAQLLGELNRSVAYAIGSNRFRGTDGDDAADKVVELMSKGPYSAKEALELGLVDGLKYKGEVVKLLTGQDAGGDIGEAKKKGEANDDDPASLKFKTLPHYARVTDRLLLSKLKDEEVIPVAVCYLRGSISAAPGDFSASTVVKGLKEAAEDEDVKAIVLRIDSGGGDVVASDSIWHAVRRAKESSGKPIIVSFGNVAASGGYYAATAADAIYASETTVTGSIGVASLRPTITRKLFDWAGVGLQTFFTGSKAQSVLHDMDEEQLKRQTQHIDETYEDFLTKVVQGRKIERDVIEDIAGGRVFTGLVAWTKTNPDALEAAEKERELRRTGGGKIEAAASLIQQVEEALGMSKPQPTGESATSVEANKQERGASSPQAKFKPSDELAEWDLQDVTKDGELDTRLVVMKASKARRVDTQEGVAQQVMHSAEDVTTKVQDALQGSKDEAQPVSSMPSVDPAEAAHREALVANGTKSEKEEQDLAARHAQESEKTSSPYGAGLVDAIGGLSDAAA